MKLASLAQAASLAIAGGEDIEVTGFAIDNRKVAPGNVFGAFEGLTVNGEQFIPDAVVAGAVAVVARPGAKVEGTTHISDPLPRRAFARLAAPFYAPFPETVVAVYSLDEATTPAALSLYATLDADLNVTATQTRLERVPMDANLRIAALHELAWMEPANDGAADNTVHAASRRVLYRLAAKLSAARGDQTVNHVDYNFAIVGQPDAAD